LSPILPGWVRTLRSEAARVGRLAWAGDSADSFALVVAVSETTESTQFYRLLRRAKDREIESHI